MSAVALALLPCLPAKADFVPATLTTTGCFIEVELDSIVKYRDGTRKFISREIEGYRLKEISLEVVDCYYPRAMFLAKYNIRAKAWIVDPDPQWYSLSRTPAGMGLQVFVCSQP